MKKNISTRQLPALVLGLGGLGLALRAWHFALGYDDKGLLPSHFTVPIVWILTVLTIAAVFILTRPLRGQGKYAKNFPASLPGAIGCWAAAAGIFLSCLGSLLDSPDGMTVIAGILGVISVPCLIMAGLSRQQGRRPSFLYHTVVCLYFTVTVISQYRHWTASPHLQLYCYQMLASIGLMLTAYNRAAFDVKIGNRRAYAFFSLVTVYLCLLAIPAATDKLYYLTMAAWLITNLCSLKSSRPKYLTPRSDPAAETPAPDQTPGTEEA